MIFFELVNKRHSVRDFSDKPVEAEKIEKILSAVKTAPSAGGLKAYEVMTIKDEGKKEKLVQAALGQDFVAEAPVVFIFSACPDVSGEKYGQRGRELYCQQDATIACAYAQLAATELGLGACWVGAFDEMMVKQVLSIEKNIFPVALLPVGYER